jgi:DNA polymerase III alpha subunit
MESSGANEAFVHLRVRSPHSLLEGAIKTPEILALARWSSPRP